MEWTSKTVSLREIREELLATMINGDRAKWDSTMLFYTILYSDCIGHGLHPVVESNIDYLRQSRNEEFAHMPKGHLSDPDFQIAIGRVHAAFQGLGLSILQNRNVRNQRSFRTEELGKVLKNVDDLKQELQEKEKKLQEKRRNYKKKQKNFKKRNKNDLSLRISCTKKFRPFVFFLDLLTTFQVAILKWLKLRNSSNSSKLSIKTI